MFGFQTESKTLLLSFKESIPHLSLNIFDLTGKSLIQTQIQSQRALDHKILVSELKSGFYILVIKGFNIDYTERFSITK